MSDEAFGESHKRVLADLQPKWEDISMSDNDLRDRIAEVINRTIPDLIDFECSEAAQAVIDLLELHETTDSLSNDMIRYETKWLNRDD